MKIKSVEQICKLADNKKAVYWVSHKKKFPAAFFQNWQGRLLVNMINQGSFEEVKY